MFCEWHFASGKLDNCPTQMVSDVYFKNGNLLTIPWLKLPAGRRVGWVACWEVEQETARLELCLGSHCAPSSGRSKGSISYGPDVGHLGPCWDCLNARPRGSVACSG